MAVSALGGVAQHKELAGLSNDDHPQYALWSQGTFAARPNAGRAGRSYYATDTGFTYYDIGTSWLEAVSSTVNIAGTQTITGMKTFGDTTNFGARAHILSTSGGATYYNDNLTWTGSAWITRETGGAKRNSQIVQDNGTLSFWTAPQAAAGTVVATTQRLTVSSTRAEIGAFDGPSGNWTKLVVRPTTSWGDGVASGPGPDVVGGTSYTTIAGGDAQGGVMLQMPHIVWNTPESLAEIRYGRVGGVSTGAWWAAGVRADDSFEIRRQGSSVTVPLKITSAGQVLASGKGVALKGHALGSSAAGSGDNTRSLDATTLNQYLVSGWYDGSNMTGAPTTDWYLIYVISHSNGAHWQRQIAHSMTGEQGTQSIYSRRCNGGDPTVAGSWSAWVRIDRGAAMSLLGGASALTNGGSFTFTAPSSGIVKLTASGRCNVGLAAVTAVINGVTQTVMATGNVSNAHNIIGVAFFSGLTGGTSYSCQLSTGATYNFLNATVEG